MRPNPTDREQLATLESASHALNSPPERDAVTAACGRAAYDAIRAHLSARGKPLVAWEDAHFVQRTAMLKGVYWAIESVSSEESYGKWLADRVAQGWKWGPVADGEAREHPEMVPYEKLPEAQTAINVLYFTVVRAVAVSLGVQVAT